MLYKRGRLILKKLENGYSQVICEIRTSDQEDIELILKKLEIENYDVE